MFIFGLEISLAVFWLVLAIIFLIVEAITVGLATIWFAAGAFIALILSLFDVAFWLQIVVFLIVSVCLLIFTRKFFVEKLKTGSEKTNTEALIGETALVTGEIYAYGVGQVKIKGQTWSAVNEQQSEPIKEGTLVKINAIEGVKLIVTPADNDK